MDIEWIRKHCLSFPGTTEQILWGNDLVFKVAGKMFCVTVLDPTYKVKMSFKCTPERFHELIEAPNIIPAPYMARSNWVGLEEWDALRTSEIKDLIEVSYELVVSKLPKKKQEELKKPKPKKSTRARSRK